MEAFIQDFVRDFKARSWNSEPMEKALHLAATAPQQLANFALAIMIELPQGGTYLDAALMFLPEQDWRDLVSTAIKHLQADPQNEAAESVLSYASLQCPQALHPLLSELFTIDKWFTAYYGVYAWRESGTQHLSFLAEQLKNDTSTVSTMKASTKKVGRRAEYNDLPARAFSALLETRTPEALAFACSIAVKLGYSAERLQSHLWNVDHEVDNDNGVIRSLAPEKTRHLQFETGYIDYPPFLSKWALPTWQTPNDADLLYRFGGYENSCCGICGERLHHVITLAPVPESIGVTGMQSLSLAVCLGCMGWEEHCLFFQHDSEGTPAALEVLPEKRAPQFPSQPLKETHIALIDTPHRWHWQSWGSSNGRENLHRLGGHPCWVQSPDYPICPGCQRAMPFLMQLDSQLRLEDETSLLWGSGGMAYFFWCDACRISAAIWQCT